VSGLAEFANELANELADQLAKQAPIQLANLSGTRLVNRLERTAAD
jgi:hypothetical protein